jgi:hypothetical protein
VKRKKENRRPDGLLREGVRLANRVGLFVLEESKAGEKRWTIYSRRTGRAVILWHPHGCDWFSVGAAGEQRGTERDLAELMRTAKRLEAGEPARQRVATLPPSNLENHVQV